MVCLLHMSYNDNNMGCSIQFDWTSEEEASVGFLAPVNAFLQVGHSS